MKKDEIKDGKNKDQRPSRSGVKLKNFTIKSEQVQFSGEDTKFRKEFKGIPDRGFSSPHEADIWLTELAAVTRKYEAYRTRLETLAKGYGFSKEEIRSLEQYLLTGEPIVLTRSLLHTKLETNKATGDKELWLRIQGDTRIEDVKNIWPEIMELQKQLPDYEIPKRGWRDFFPQKRIFELYQKLGSAKKLAEIMTKDTGIEWDEQKVWRMVSDFKKRLKVSQKTPH